MLHSDSASQPKDQVQGRLLLDVVVAQSTTIFQLLPSKDQTLLVRWDPLLVLDLGFHILDRVRWLNVKSDCLASQSLDKDLHSAAETKHQVQGRLLLDVVVAQSATIFQLLTSKDQTLLVRWDALLVLDLGFHILDRVRWLDIECNGFTREGFDENLHRVRLGLLELVCSCL